MGYWTGSVSFGSTGEKAVVLDLGGVPTWVRITMGARSNTTESGEIFSYGTSDGERTHCFASWPGGSKRWPYTSEPNYVGVGYSSGGVKKVSVKLSDTETPFEDDQLNLCCDVADANYPLKIECGN